MVLKITSKLHRFTALDPSDVQAIEGALQFTRQYAAHADIVRVGHMSDHVVAMVTGWAARYNIVSDGRRQITAFLMPGDVCDLSTCSDQSLTALTPATVAHIRPSDLDHLVAMHPNTGRAWRDAQAAEDRRLRALVTSIGRLDSQQRVGHALCDLWCRADAIGLVQDGYMPFPLTQPDLADYTGLTAVHVNRMMRRLRTQGLIDLKDRSRSMALPEFDRLARVSEYERTLTGTNRGTHPTPFIKRPSVGGGFDPGSGPMYSPG